MKINRLLVLSLLVCGFVSCNKEEEIPVTPKTNVTDISFDQTQILLAPGDEYKSRFTIKPEGANYQWIKWSSSNTKVAKVDEYGNIHADDIGKSEITVEADNGISARCMVYVSRTPVSTTAAYDVTTSKAYINPEVDENLQKLDMTGFVIFSDTQISLENLIKYGKKTEETRAISEFYVSLRQLKNNQTYHYVAGLNVLGQTYYGEVKMFTTKVLPEDAVDLGLSSCWRKFNLGASKPQEYGKYFAWGDVEGQTWNGTKWSGDGFYKAPACKLEDFTGELDKKYDAAHVVLGSTWRMPNDKDINELDMLCTKTWTENYQGTGANGFIYTSKLEGYTTQSIFLPACGCGDADVLDYPKTRTYFGYWSRALSGDSPDYAYILDDLMISHAEERRKGLPIRPVSD